MKIKVLKPGKYMVEDLTAKACQAGDVIDTRQWYAKELVAEGKAMLVEEPKVEPKAPVKKTPAKKVQKEKSVSVQNPFLEK